MLALFQSIPTEPFVPGEVVSSRLALFEVKGDEMNETYRPGDMLLVDLTDRVPSPEGTFIVWDGLAHVVRRIQYIPHTRPARVWVICDNPKYRSYEREPAEACIYGRVVGSVRRC